MSTTTLSFTAKINGELVDMDSVYLADQNEDFGVRRLDTLDVVVDKDTVVPRLSLGTYRYSFDDPEPGLTYEYTLKVTYSGITYYYNRQTSPGDIQTLVAIPTTDHYTSQTEVYRYLGEYAVNLMIDDYAGEDKGYIWNDLLQNADDTIKMYIMQHYDPDTLYENTWVRRRATILVANLLSSRRGNNPLYVSATERVYDELNMVRDGRMHIPAAKGAVGNAMRPRSWQGPIWSNYQMQNRFYNHPVRVESSKSSTRKQVYSQLDYALEPFFLQFGTQVP
jgi:hypothetical protein